MLFLFFLLFFSYHIHILLLLSSSCPYFLSVYLSCFGCRFSCYFFLKKSFYSLHYYYCRPTLSYVFRLCTTSISLISLVCAFFFTANICLFFSAQNHSYFLLPDDTFPLVFYFVRQTQPVYPSISLFLHLLLLSFYPFFVSSVHFCLIIIYSLYVFLLSITTLLLLLFCTYLLLHIFFLQKSISLLLLLFVLVAAAAATVVVVVAKNIYLFIYLKLS